jgi:hypothetical protein
MVFIEVTSMAKNTCLDGLALMFRKIVDVWT